MNIKHWLKFSVLKLLDAEYSKIDAEILLSYVLRKSRIWLITFDNYELNIQQLERLNYLLKRRILGEPIAYLIEKKEFWSISLYVSSQVLIPRSETEMLIEHTLHRLKNVSQNILDLGTGSGAIALALAKTRPDCNITGIDYIEEAIKIAQYNANQLNLTNTNFFYSNWFSEIKSNTFDIIVSNPPYVCLEDINFLKKEIFFEPYLSLISSENGLSDIQHIIKYAKKYLKNKGWLLIEHSWRQKNTVIRLFQKYNYIQIQSYKDYADYDRITVGRII
ncbi:MAG TPA: peptide chain release factor N(5)-glutamine methyltransferase [Buchnera sp. (in: enterobacteria)]|nr:peptide chain release factor N(5)-glutamine methyltransferase [Buchnera sp. (in: enterobacteria)]